MKFDINQTIELNDTQIRQLLAACFKKEIDDVSLIIIDDDEEYDLSAVYNPSLKAIIRNDTEVDI